MSKDIVQGPVYGLKRFYLYHPRDNGNDIVTSHHSTRDRVLELCHDTRLIPQFDYYVKEAGADMSMEAHWNMYDGPVCTALNWGTKNAGIHSYPLCNGTLKAWIIRQRHTNTIDNMPVFGLVSLVGEVIECEVAYRAQKIVVERLWMLRHHDLWDDAEYIASCLGDKYRCEVSFGTRESIPQEAEDYVGR